MNEFDQLELQRWFDGNVECWVCGRNHWDAFHHIVGRGSGADSCERSILNAAPVNNYDCHLRIHGALVTGKNIRILLRKTYKYLTSKGYVLGERDRRFLSKYASYYD